MKKTVAIVCCSLALGTSLKTRNAMADQDRPITHTVDTAGSAHNVDSVLPDRADLPSCRAITYRGNAGYIAVQTAPDRTVTWGVYMYNPLRNYGHWIADVYVDGRRVDHKDQLYPPHGKVNPKHARSGSEFHITATVRAVDGEFHSAPNGCIIP